MNKILITFLLICNFLQMASCVNISISAYPTKFDINKCVSIGNWLTGSNARGEERARFFTADDIDKLISYGFDHLRLSVDEVQICDEKGNIDQEAITLVHKTIRRCQERNMRVIFDLHTIRNHHFFKGNENNLWTSRKAQDRLIQIWKKIMKELEQYPETFLAYELLNELVAPKNEQ